LKYQLSSCLSVLPLYLYYVCFIYVQISADKKVAKAKTNSFTTERSTSKSFPSALIPDQVTYVFTLPGPLPQLCRLAWSGCLLSATKQVAPVCLLFDMRVQPIHLQRLPRYCVLLQFLRALQQINLFSLFKLGRMLLTGETRRFL